MASGVSNAVNLPHSAQEMAIDGILLHLAVPNEFHGKEFHYVSYEMGDILYTSACISWSKAFGTDSYSSWETGFNWNSSNKGIDLSKTDKNLGSSGPIWYPAAGFRRPNNMSLKDVGKYGNYLAVSSRSEHEDYCLIFDYFMIYTMNGRGDATGLSVRCQKE